MVAYSSFNAQTGQFLGATAFPQFIDIRSFSPEKANDCVYMATFGTQGNGYISRHIGNVSAPFAFDIVAKVLGQPAEVNWYNAESLVVSIWAYPSPSSIVGIEPGKLLISPAMKKLPRLVALTPTNAAAAEALPLTPGFGTVWDIRSYEPDLVTAYSIGASDVAVSPDGWVYWGTFQFPPFPILIYSQYYGPTNPIGNLIRALGTLRPTSIFRGRAFENVLKGGTPVIELLYGERFWPTYNNATKLWTISPNKMGALPKYGRAGFGMPTNVYVWAAAQYKGDTLLSTFDESFMVSSLLRGLVSQFLDKLPQELISMSPQAAEFLAVIDGLLATPAASPLVPFGADLYVFKPNRPAEYITRMGLDNMVNYGIRNIFNDPKITNDPMWMTTANPFNLNPGGGWEIYRLDKVTP